jgi:hypothetical protein
LSRRRSTVVIIKTDDAAPVAVLAAGTCFDIRMMGVRFGLNAPRPPAQRE